MKAKLVWPPHPYRAGFCITDDTDAATFEQVKAVYDYLLSRNFRTTRTVWAFKPMDRCGVPPIPDSALRGITLEDRRYLEYCKTLHERGFEICLHGASAGNNTREYTRRACEAAVGGPVEVKLLKSVAAGDDECLFEVKIL